MCGTPYVSRVMLTCPACCFQRAISAGLNFWACAARPVRIRSSERSRRIGPGIGETVGAKVNEKALAGGPGLFNNNRKALRRERRAAAAGALGLGVVEHKAAGIEPVLEVDFHAQHVHGVLFIHDEL